MEFYWSSHNVNWIICVHFVAGLFLFNSFREAYDYLVPHFDLSCGVECKFMWDGYGRWVDGSWQPYVTGELHAFFGHSNGISENVSVQVSIFPPSRLSSVPPPLLPSSHPSLLLSFPSSTRLQMLVPRTEYSEPSLISHYHIWIACMAEWEDQDKFNRNYLWRSISQKLAQYQHRLLKDPQAHCGCMAIHKPTDFTNR